MSVSRAGGKPRLLHQLLLPGVERIPDTFVRNTFISPGFWCSGFDVDVSCADDVIVGDVGLSMLSDAAAPMRERSMCSIRFVFLTAGAEGGVSILSVSTVADGDDEFARNCSSLVLNFSAIIALWASLKLNDLDVRAAKGRSPLERDDDGRGL